MGNLKLSSKEKTKDQEFQGFFFFLDAIFMLKILTLKINFWVFKKKSETNFF